MKALQSFVGNPLPREILSRAVSSGKLGHAYLFSGEEGIGKRTLARAVGLGLLCPRGFPPCETCESCRRASDGIHPDLMEIFPDGNTFKIAQIKQLQERLSLKPVYGGKKVFILDAVDLMNSEAANAFLKSLEEPPPETHFFLITSRPHLLPDTILSRCQQIRFFPPSTGEIASFLLKKREASPEEAAKIAKRAGGRVGVALTLDSAAIDAEDQKMKRLVDPETLASHSRIFQLSEEMGRDAENLRAALDWLSLWIRDMLIWKQTKAPDLLDRSEEASSYERLEPFHTRKTLLEAFHLIRNIERNLVRNLNRSLVLEYILLRLGSFKNSNPLFLKESA